MRETTVRQRSGHSMKENNGGLDLRGHYRQPTYMLRSTYYTNILDVYWPSTTAIRVHDVIRMRLAASSITVDRYDVPHEYSEVATSSVTVRQNSDDSVNPFLTYYSSVKQIFRIGSVSSDFLFVIHREDNLLLLLNAEKIIAKCGILVPRWCRVVPNFTST